MVVAKLAFSVGLLAFLASLADWRDIGTRLDMVEGVWLLAACAVLSFVVPLAGLRWHLVAQGVGADMGLGFTVRVTHIALFVGQFLPAGLGGDAVRGWFAYRSGRTLPQVASGIVLDRPLGLLSLAILLVTAMPLLTALAPPDMAVTVRLAVSSIALATVVVLLVDRLPWPARFVRGRLGAMMDWIALMRRSLWSKTVVAALAASLAVQLILVVATALLARGLNLPVGFLDCLAIVPVTILLTNIPVSLNGWGMREGVMVVGFGLAGVGPADALLLSVLLGFALVLVTAPGLPMWLTLRSMAPR